MAHRIVGEIQVGSVVKVYEPHQYAFARWRVLSVSTDLSSFGVARGATTRVYKVREKVEGREFRATLTEQENLV